MSEGIPARQDMRSSSFRSEEHTSELQSRLQIVCRLLLEKKKETQQFVSGKTGIGLYKNDWTTFALSVGAAYSPSFEHGLVHRLVGEPGSSSIRGGHSVTD